MFRALQALGLVTTLIRTYQGITERPSRGFSYLEERISRCVEHLGNGGIPSLVSGLGKKIPTREGSYFWGIL